MHLLNTSLCYCWKRCCAITSSNGHEEVIKLSILPVEGLFRNFIKICPYLRKPYSQVNLWEHFGFPNAIEHPISSWNCCMVSFRAFCQRLIALRLPQAYTNLSQWRKTHLRVICFSVSFPSSTRFQLIVWQNFALQEHLDTKDHDRARIFSIPHSYGSQVPWGGGGNLWSRAEGGRDFIISSIRISQESNTFSEPDFWVRNIVAPWTGPKIDGGFLIHIISCLLKPNFVSYTFCVVEWSLMFRLP